jgi:type I restriction enzyme R subunit
MKNEAFFKLFITVVVQEFKKNENIPLDFPTTKETINNLIINEYLQQYYFR